MVSLRIATLLKLTRADGATLAFLVFLLPCYVHSADAPRAVSVAIPIFLMALCTFILNNINDADRDQVNHPDRPIPSGSISLHTAALVYSLVFVSCIITTRIFIDTQVQYYYLGGLLLSINYSTIVNNLTYLKNPYAALGHALPIVLVGKVCGHDAVPAFLAPAVFLFSLGREILMDLRDVAGDGATWVKAVSPASVIGLAFGLQAISIVLLIPCVHGWATTAALAVIAAMFAILLFLAVSGRPAAVLVRLMKLQLGAGLLFLI